MLEDRLTPNKTLERIGRIRSEIENAFKRGSIDFDMIESELKSLADDIESNTNHAKSDKPDSLVPRTLLRPEDYR